MSNSTFKTSNPRPSHELNKFASYLFDEGIIKILVHVRDPIKSNLHVYFQSHVLIPLPSTRTCTV